MVPPPQWTETTGMDPNLFTQGVYNPEGMYPGGGGQQEMKMVGFAPWGMGGGGYAEGDPSSMGLQLGGDGSNPMFAGKKGLMQCGINQQTGEYMTDAQGNARCWYMPVIAGSGFTKGGGGMGTWLDTDSDIVHYQAQASALSLMASLGKALFLSVGVGLALSIAFFIWRISINKRMQKGTGPGIFAKLLHWDTWKLWGNKYSKQSAVFAAEDGGNVDDELNYIDVNAVDVPVPEPTAEKPVDAALEEATTSPN